MASTTKRLVVGAVLLLASLGIGRSYYAPLDEALSELQAQLPVPALGGVLELGKTLGLGPDMAQDPRFMGAPRPELAPEQDVSLKVNAALPDAQPPVVQTMDASLAPAEVGATDNGGAPAGAPVVPGSPDPASTAMPAASSGQAVPPTGAAPAPLAPEMPAVPPASGAPPGAKPVSAAPPGAAVGQAAPLPQAANSSPLSFSPTPDAKSDVLARDASKSADVDDLKVRQSAGTVHLQLPYLGAPGGLGGAGAVGSLPPGLGAGTGLDLGKFSMKLEPSPFTGNWSGRFEGAHLGQRIRGTLQLTVLPMGQLKGRASVQGNQALSVSFNGFIAADGRFILVPPGGAPLVAGVPGNPYVDGTFEPQQARGTWRAGDAPAGIWSLSRERS